MSLGSVVGVWNARQPVRCSGGTQLRSCFQTLCIDWASPSLASLNRPCLPAVPGLPCCRSRGGGAGWGLGHTAAWGRWGRPGTLSGRAGGSGPAWEPVSTRAGEGTRVVVSGGGRTPGGLPPCGRPVGEGQPDPGAVQPCKQHSKCSGHEWHASWGMNRTCALGVLHCKVPVGWRCGTPMDRQQTDCRLCRRIHRCCHQGKRGCTSQAYQLPCGVPSPSNIPAALLCRGHLLCNGAVPLEPAACCPPP